MLAPIAALKAAALTSHIDCPNFLALTAKVPSGISSIDDDTPGFEVVLSEGDMRLYKIAV